MKWKSLFTFLLSSLLLACSSTNSPSPTSIDTRSHDPTTSQACSSFCLDNSDHCVFGANQDNQIDDGLLFVNKRNVLKTAWDPSTMGEYAHWISRYGSVTIVHAGYQMAWAGMNEAGLMIGTMALGETQNPPPDERPPLASSFWAQYQLDNHGTVEEVIASDSLVRIDDTVDHYLICDRKGECATIEFLEGKMVAHTSETLPVKALTNSVYQEALDFWEDGGLIRGVRVHDVGPDSPVEEAGIRPGDWITAIGEVKLDGDDPVATLISEINANYAVGDEVHLSVLHQGDQEPVTVSLKLKSYITEEGEEIPVMGRIALSSGNSLYRFVTLAERLEAYELTNSEQAVTYAFDTLAEVAGDSNAWQIVFDPANLVLYFRTNRNPQIRYLDFSKLDFSCQTPVRMLDVHADGSGDISDDLVVYSHAVSYNHTIRFVEQYERLDLPPLLVEALLRGLEGFPCKEGDASAQPDSINLEYCDPFLSPRVTWIGLTIALNAWPFWLPLTLLSLAYVIWRMTRGESTIWRKRLVWILMVALFGPLGLLIYLIVYRKRDRFSETAAPPIEGA
jgi:penicillin V acylase-like amidase (Ntn superfamily)